jgi:hypothetical protein
VNFSYGVAVGGAPAWTRPATVATGHSNGTQKGSNGQFPDHETIRGGHRPRPRAGRVDLVFYDRACDPADTRNCLTLASTADSGQTWGITPLTRKGFDSAAQVLWTGNGPHAMDVFSQRVTF